MIKDSEITWELTKAFIIHEESACSCHWEEEFRFHMNECSSPAPSLMSLIKQNIKLKVRAVYFIRLSRRDQNLFLQVKPEYSREIKSCVTSLMTTVWLLWRAMHLLRNRGFSSSDWLLSPDETRVLLCIHSCDLEGKSVHNDGSSQDEQLPSSRS